MGTAVFGVRVLLAAVFALAGIAKLMDLPGSRQAMRDFGISDSVADLAGLALPLTELLAAVLLLIGPTAQVGGALAFALLIAFIAGIVNALRHGVAPDCHCFGQLYSAPADQTTLLRNGVLAVLAAFVVVEGPGPSINEFFNTRSAGDVAAVVFGVLAVILASYAAQLYREAKRLGEDLGVARRIISAAPPGLPVGARAPEFELESSDGGTVSLAELLAREHPLLLVFASPNCGSCVQLFPNIRRWQQTLAGRVTIAVISVGSLQENELLYKTHELETVLLQAQDELIESYRIRGTPSAVLVNPDGTIGSIPAESVFGIEPMVRLVLRDSAAPMPEGSLA